MRKALPIVVRHAGLLAAVLLGACGSGKDASVTVVAIGDPAAPFEKGVRLSPPARLVRGATVEGLVGFDEQGQIVPALADRWIVTDDGLSYIFRLREGTWPDGSALTAEGLRGTLRETIAGLRGTPLALDLGGIEEIRAMTGRVIEIRLAAPMPNLLQLLAQPELGLARRGQGAGPMRLRRDRDVALLVAIPPEQRGQPAVEGWNQQQRPLRFLALPAQAAVDRFNGGEADILLGGRIEDFPLARSIGLLRGTIQIDPVMGLFGLAVTREADASGAFLAAPENREALAMAIDRDNLLEPFGVSGWSATARMVASGVADDPGTIGERWAGISLDERRKQAAGRIARWRQGRAGAPPVRLRIALPRGQGGDMLFAQLAGDLQSIGIEAQRAGLDDAADLRLVDAVARYPRAAWFLDQLSCVADRGLCSKDADDLAAQALRTSDPAMRANLLADAEATLTKANVFIPFGAPIRWSLVRGQATGFAANRWNIHPLMPMALVPK